MKFLKSLFVFHSTTFYWARRIFGLGSIIVGGFMTIYAIGAILGLSSEYSVSEGWSLALITVSLAFLGVIMVRERPRKGK
jgi:hypothetical protein